MGTALSEIYDLFMQTVTDYRLIELFKTSEDDFETFLEAWLIFAINDFSICNQDLSIDALTNSFTVILTTENKVMLAKLMNKYWWQKLVNDITQINLHVMDRDFKMPSESQNLREKMAALNIAKEDCSQALTDYGYRKLNWNSWFNQDFAGV